MCILNGSNVYSEIVFFFDIKHVVICMHSRGRFTDSDSGATMLRDYPTEKQL